MDFELPEEHRAFRDIVRRWVDTECPKAWARQLEADEHNYPHALWAKFSEAGFHGVGIAEEFGGQGGDVLMQMLLARELARSLGGLAWIWGITSFAGSKSIGLYGTPEQQTKYLPEIAAGRLKAAISFTEPGGGTDLLGGMTTRAEKADGGWVLNGEKIWSSSAHVADYLLCIARTDSNVEKKHQGLTLFWVPTKSEGIKITPLAKPNRALLSPRDFSSNWRLECGTRAKSVKTRAQMLVKCLKRSSRGTSAATPAKIAGHRNWRRACRHCRALTSVTARRVTTMKLLTTLAMTVALRAGRAT